MTKADPIIAVKDIEASCRWYQSVLGCRRSGMHLITLLSEDGSVLLCLHPWGEHGHPTMKDATITAGNGLILYFRTARLDEMYNNVVEEGYAIEDDMHVNPNSLKREFSLRDPDGYYITITEYHEYRG